MKFSDVIWNASRGLINVATLAIFGIGGAFADVLTPPSMGNQLTVLVEPMVTQDPNTGIYTYNYTVTNNLSSIQEIWLFAVELAPGTNVLSSSAPQGWNFSVHADQPLASWAAIEVPEPPEDYVDDGNVLPSPYNLRPGETRGGFSFQTLAAPSDGSFYAQGFTLLPAVSGDVEEVSEAGYTVLPLTEDSHHGITTTPAVFPYGGGRRPAVDGFLVFLNMQKTGNTFVSPMTIIVKFAAGGETVDRASFSATLNQIDVTHLFVEDRLYGGDLVAEFSFDGSPLKPGTNVLVTSVEGIVPDTTRTASDVDRITFTVQN